MDVVPPCGGRDAKDRAPTGQQARPRQKGKAAHEANHLLGHIARYRPEVCAALLAQAETVPFGFEFTPYRRSHPVQHVYFLRSGVIATVARSLGSKEVTVAIVGNEGMTGLGACLGAPSPDMTHCARVPGVATRVSVAAFRRALRQDIRLAGVVLRYARYAAMQMAQSNACNALHSTTQRCARWLLMVRDRVGAETFPLRQEYVASMLGTRPHGAAVATNSLRASGLIRYDRGEISVLDSARLEAAACECYAVDRRCLAHLVHHTSP
jgi:CRP-like cAMP-binding protein